MPARPSGIISPATDRLLSLATGLTLGAAALLTVVWLWCCWCNFPAFPWNDIRVAPAVALHHGISVYSPANSGPASTWIYGPMPLIVLWPAGLARSAIGAIEIAGSIHIGFTVLALTLTCLLWPATAVPLPLSKHSAQAAPERIGGTRPPDGSARCAPEKMRPEAAFHPDQLHGHGSAGAGPTWPRRLTAALLCVLLVRNQTSGYLVYCADATGLAFGLLSLLALARRQFWLAAWGVAAAAACKQTLVGVGVAQLAWLALTVSPRAAGQHFVRQLLAGSVLAITAIGYFGAPGLWHTMVEIPSRFPWVAVSDRLREHRPYLLLHVALPVALMLGGRKYFLAPSAPALLPALAFGCTLPLSIAGFMKIGGNVNSLHGFWLWFPPVLAAGVQGDILGRLGRYCSLALALLALLVASLWLQTSRLSALPNVQAYREATYLAGRMPEKIWFPMHPLVTLYSDGRLYHDSDGLRERAFAGQAVTAEHFFAQMPRLRQASATLLPVGWGLADLADARLPADTPVTSFGQWRVDGRLE